MRGPPFPPPTAPFLQSPLQYGMPSLSSRRLSAVTPPMTSPKHACIPKVVPESVAQSSQYERRIDSHPGVRRSRRLPMRHNKTSHQPFQSPAQLDSTRKQTHNPAGTPSPQSPLAASACHRRLDQAHRSIPHQPTGHRTRPTLPAWNNFPTQLHRPAPRSAPQPTPAGSQRVVDNRPWVSPVSPLVNPSGWRPQGMGNRPPAQRASRSPSLSRRARKGLRDHIVRRPNGPTILLLH